MYSLKLPSRYQKFIRAPANWLHEALSQISSEVVEEKDKRIFKINIGKVTGVTLKIRLIPEGDASSLEFIFIYRRLVFISFASIIIFIGLSLLLPSPIPLIGLIVIPIMIYSVSFKVDSFLNNFNNILAGLENEYARRRIMEDRIRWQREPKNIDDLYRRLCNKYIKIWGSTYALEYKINEYQRQGLSRDEAIRKISEEEGIF